MKSKLLLIPLVMITMFFLAPGCVADYDITEDASFDETIKIGSNVKIPIGTIKPILLSEELDLEDGNIIKMNSEGNYYISFNENDDMSFNITDKVQGLTIDGTTANPQTITWNVPIIPPIPGVDITSADFDPFTSTNLYTAIEQDYELILDTLIIPINADFSTADGIKEIHKILFDGGGLITNILANFSNNTYLTNDPDLNIVMKFPDKFIFDEQEIKDGDKVIFSVKDDGEGYVFITVNDKIFEGEYSIPNVRIKGVKLNSEKIINETIKVSSKVSIHLDKNDILNHAGDELTVILNSSIGSLTPTDFYGILDYELEAMETTIQFDDIPDMLKEDGSSMDLLNPSLKFLLTHNMGMRVITDLKLSSYKDNELLNEESTSLTINASDDGSEVSTGYILSKSQITDPDYIWQELDLGGLIKTLPDYIVVNVTAYPDVTTEAHIILNSTYSTDYSYDFKAPFAFGEDFKVFVKDTLDDITEDFSDIIKDNEVSINGSLENSSPLAFNITIIPIDKEGNEIDLNISSSYIKSAKNGEAVITPFALTLDGSKLGDKIINKLIIKLDIISSEDSGNQTLSQDDYISGSLYLYAANGIIIKEDDK